MLLTGLFCGLGLFGPTLARPPTQASLATVVIEQQDPDSTSVFNNQTIKVPIDLPAESPVLIVNPRLLSRFYLLDPAGTTCNALFDTVPATQFPTITGPPFTTHSSVAIIAEALSLNRAKLRFWCTSKLAASQRPPYPQQNSSVHAARGRNNRPAVIKKSENTIPPGYNLGKCPSENGPIGAIQVCECYDHGLETPKDHLMDYANNACLSINAMQFGPGRPEFETSFPLFSDGEQFGEVVAGLYYRGGSNSCDYATRDGYTIQRDVCGRAFSLMLSGW